MSRKNPPINEEDARLFQEMMEGVTPLPKNKIEPGSAPKAGKPKRELKETKPHSQFGELEYAPAVAADENLLFARDGVQQKILAKLKKGQFPIEARIDLHGSTVNDAGARLEHALKVALGNQQRCVLIVHGRGMGSLGNKPAIKTHVNQWLRDSSDVLAFVTALPQHGGTGAVYVLLKRQREK
ncbi:MAG: Smr/MutS family endonuclease [Gammaproteobacteria bacterium]|nr:Smr/MutS family endonuclease [Gammaproteobacteria bacterium]